MNKSVKERVEDFKRAMLRDALAQCTESQQAMFSRLYPGTVPEDKLENAIDLCERTIRKNLTGRQ